MPIGPEGLAAGAITAQALPGAIGLRDVAVAGEILLRGVQFVVRNRHWGTYTLEAHQALQLTRDAVELACTGTLEGQDGDLAWDARFRLSAAGLEARCEMRSRRGFETNRTGLVVLHDLPACRGQPVLVRHTGGRTTSAQFPELVSPYQPFRDIAGLTHGTPRGHLVAFEFGGEVFETEDQRNWTDASFKTYSRPLDRPYPYRLVPGETVVQRIHVTVAVARGERISTGQPHQRIRAVVPALVAPPREAPGPFAAFNRGEALKADFDWSCSPTVHAADDDTIGETVEALADLVATAQVRAPGRLLRIGPLRLETPIGDVPPPPDPRRGGPIEAAWVLGSLAGLIDPMVAALAFDTPSGAAGHLLARLGPFQGCSAEAIDWSGNRRVKGLIAFGQSETLLFVAHLSHAAAPLRLPNGNWTRPQRLDTTGFVPIDMPEVLVGFTVLCFVGGS